MKATEKQVGGSHYDMPHQPIEFITENGLNFIQGNIVKYVSRYKSKNGLEDLEKAKHYAELGLELEGNQHLVCAEGDVLLYCMANSFNELQRMVILRAICKEYSEAAKEISKLIEIEKIGS